MNFSISEIMVILLIALLVIKPEQLPEVAHAFGQLTQAVRNFFSKVKADVDEFVKSSEAERKRD